MPTLKWGSGKSSFLDKLANESKPTQAQAQTTVSEESKQEKKVVETHDAEPEKIEQVVSQTEKEEGDDDNDDHTILSVGLFELFHI